MSASLNSISIIGNVGQEPVMRVSDSGLHVLSFTVAVNQKLSGKESKEWFNVSTFGKTAEACHMFLAKGKQVFVEGRIQLKSFTGKDGLVKSRMEISANKVLFLGKLEAKEETEARLSDWDIGQLPF